MRRAFLAGGVALAVSAGPLHAGQTTPARPRREAHVPRHSQVAIVKLDGRSAAVTTDAGAVRVALRGQIALRLGTGPAGQARVSLEQFNLRAASVRSRRGDTGRLSVTLVPGTARAATSGPGAGSTHIAFTAALHYRLIDRTRPPYPVSPDDYAAHVEKMTGRLTVALRPLRSAGARVDSVAVAASLELSEAIVGAVRDIRFDSLPASVRNLFPPCDSIGKQVLCIQPVFIRDGPHDPEPTGRALDTFMDHARQIWRKCCVDFDVRGARYVDDGSFKVISDAEIRALRDQVDVEDCVEVFFAASWDPEGRHGGGATYLGGTADSYVVTADDNIDQEVPSVNHLGHELGHSVTLCHPDVGCVAPRVDGTARTVMEPSGFRADNPDDQSQQNCSNASNPLLEFVQVHCCARPEIR